MSRHAEFQSLLLRREPLLFLAPMQDVTDHSFWQLMAEYGGADIYVTEYFRVTADSRLDKWILQSITQNPTGRPAVAQMIGNDIPALVRTARELEHHPVAAIDLNLGCPAPVVYRKCAGGGLLRDPERIDRILGALREAVSIPFTVKTRIGFDDARVFDHLLPIFEKNRIDLLTVHGRTVAERYVSEVHYDAIARAAAALSCPVVANGNVHSAGHAARVLAITGARGLMIGRGAIRNPWIFDQIRRRQRGLPVIHPTGREILHYIRRLYESTAGPEVRESAQVRKMKKYMNFLALGVEPTGRFLHDIRRVSTTADFFAACGTFLDHENPLPLIPFDLQLPKTDNLAGQHR